MAYLGNRPAESYASFETETFSVSATTNYTLSHAVTNENEIRLVINGVVQQPGSGKAYTASGTTLTLSSATVSGDVMYAVYLGRALQTVNPPNASVGNSQTAPTIITGQTAEATIATDDTILIHDTSASALRKMTRANFVSGIGGTNSSMFSAKSTANQTGLSSGGWTKVQFDTATFNVGSDYDATNDKYVAPSAGKYFFTASVKVNSAGGSTTLLGTGLRFTINGSTAGDNLNFIATGSLSAMNATNTAILNLTATQYVEVYAYYQDNGGGTGSITGSSDLSTQFYGCKLIT